MLLTRSTEHQRSRRRHALLSAVAAGSLTPSDAAEIGKLVDAHVKAIEVMEVLVRLEKLEQRL
jgi:hypothetical protein